MCRWVALASLALVQLGAAAASAQSPREELADPTRDTARLIAHTSATPDAERSDFVHLMEPLNGAYLGWAIAAGVGALVGAPIGFLVAAATGADFFVHLASIPFGALAGVVTLAPLGIAIGSWLERQDAFGLERLLWALLSACAITALGALVMIPAMTDPAPLANATYALLGALAASWVAPFGAWGVQLAF